MSDAVLNFAGIDLHKKSITVCVVDQGRKVLVSRRFLCAESDRIVEFFRELGAFRAVVEATGSYEWLFQLLEPLADRLVLAHPQKLRIIAESTRKSDKLDARILAEFLALDMIPEAYRPTPRERSHRRLVRYRAYLMKRVKSVRTKIRAILAEYNADRRDLFTIVGLKYLSEVKVSGEDRFVLDQLVAEWQRGMEQVQATQKRLREFAASAPTREAEARAILASIPQVAEVTVDVVCAELGDVRRFGSQKRVASYAGLAPGYRKSDDHKWDLAITKEGSGLLRWTLVEAAWRLVQHTQRWGSAFESLAKRRGRKRAIVAVARRLLCVMVSMLQSGQAYRPAMP